MASNTPLTYNGVDQRPAQLDHSKSAKSLETEVGTPRSRRGNCCCGCLNCFFCYIPWIPVILSLVCLAAAIIAITTIRRAASRTHALIDTLSFSNNASVTQIFNAIPVAATVFLIVMIVLVAAIIVLSLLRANQRAMHRGVYHGKARCEKSCCYWSLLVPGYIISALWWALLAMVVVLLMALVLWLAVFLGLNVVSGYAIQKSASLSDQINGETTRILDQVQGFVRTQNATLQNVLRQSPSPLAPLLLQQFNQALGPVAQYVPQPAGCQQGCLDVSMFGDKFGSQQCICARDTLQPIKDRSMTIVKVLIWSFASACALYLAASLLLVNLAIGNTNSYRDKEELKLLRQDWQAQHGGNQFIQAPDVEQAPVRG